MLQACRADAVKQGDLARADWWQHDMQTLDAQSRAFPAGHRLAFRAEDVALRHGYLNAPIQFAWLRAPYLHNGSVPTLKALIGRPSDRPVTFCRGNLGYDREAIGVMVETPTNGQCTDKAPFLFDTTQSGNSSAGHAYPSEAVGDDDRAALLAYLGTL